MFTEISTMDKKRTFVGIIIVATIVFLGLGSWWGYTLKQRADAYALYEAAQTIERTEGRLSKSACIKYKNIEANSLDSNESKDLVMKVNDCTKAENLFEETERTEKEKGLNYETAVAYKKIEEGYPGSVFAKQAERKLREFEAVKKATLQAWNELQDADGRGSRMTKGSQYYQEMIRLYGKIELENVDIILVEQIKASIDTYNQGEELFLELEQEAQEINEAKQELVELTKMIGRNHPDAPSREVGEYVGETKGKELAENLGRTAAQETLKKYEPRIREFHEKYAKINEMDKVLSSRLGEKYKVAFIDRY